jgi:hypothetical protein
MLPAKVTPAAAMDRISLRLWIIDSLPSSRYQAAVPAR